MIYFLPEFFIPALKFYIKINKNKIDETGFLFPKMLTLPGGNKYNFVNSNYVRSALRNKSLEKYLNTNEPHHPHAFRDAINSYRAQKIVDGIKITQRDLDLLLNQKSKGVNVKHYQKRFKNWKKLRDTYDHYFPYPKLIFIN